MLILKTNDLSLHPIPIIPGFALTVISAQSGRKPADTARSSPLVLDTSAILQQDGLPGTDGAHPRAWEPVVADKSVSVPPRLELLHASRTQAFLV